MLKVRCTDAPAPTCSAAASSSPANHQGRRHAIRAGLRLGRQLRSLATTGGGKQNILCAYLSVAVLIGLGANALGGLWWADPVAAFAVAIAAIQAGIGMARQPVRPRVLTGATGYAGDDCR